MEPLEGGRQAPTNSDASHPMRISSVAATLLDYLPDFEGHSVWKLGVKIFHGTASVVDSFPVHVRMVRIVESSCFASENSQVMYGCCGLVSGLRGDFTEHVRCVAVTLWPYMAK